MHDLLTGLALSAGMVSVVVTSSVLVVASGTGVRRARVQDVEAEVAASFGPLVVLLGQHGADEADQGVAAGEDPDHVGAAADLPVEPLGVGVGPGRGVHRFDGSVSPARASEPDVRVPTHPALHVPVPVRSAGVHARASTSVIRATTSP
jgi:hypothetical protein